jgi:THO complex subunit 2
MPPKRKRNERASDVVENRPSPHRPQNTNLGQHESRPDMRDTGRRSSRGGQGGLGGGRGRGRDNPNKLNTSGTGRATPGPMSPPPRPSSATQTPTQVSTPTAELPSPLIKRDPAPFDYAFLTDDRVASWDSTGRQELTDLGIQARQDEDPMDLSTVFQELTRATLDGRLDAADAGNCLKDILGPEPSSADGSTTIFDPHTFFLDIFSMLYETEDGPMNPALRTFLASTGISPTLMRQKLDNNLLQDLLLTRDTFSRVGVRQATNLLYRQANYNLLREETEGYSKLVTELFTTSASEPPTSEVVEDAFERVKGLIGTFDLDVGRVLDITLDVFAAVLIKHFRFFIKLLRVSSWWPRHAEGDVINVARFGGLPTWALPSHASYLPTEEDDELFKLQRKSRDTLFWARAREVGLDAYFELGGREMLDEETKIRLLNRKGNGDAELDADRQWIQATGTLPPSGNRVAAQLLGFKLRFYTSDARDKDDILPANLIYLTALLIKIGFISLRDLYAHLWPLDEDMPAVLVKKRKELEEKERLNRPGGGASNALTMAGALPDDTLPNNGRVRESTTAKPDSTAKAAAEVEDPDKLDEPTDQKVQLLVCLLTIGAIPESLFILGRFPWLPEAYPELIDLINRILHYSIKDLYDATRPSTTQDPECPTKKIPDVDQNGVPKGHVRLTQLPPRKQLRWPFPDRNDTNESNSYRFYWDEWADNVPVCQNVDDMFTLCGTLLQFSGVGIGKDVSLLSKLARIGTKSLTEDSSRSNLDRWQDLLKRLLVPALSLTKSNTAVVNEIYEMLRFYPLSVRYAIYAEWFEGQTSRLPLMKTAFERARLETLSTMKRISLTNLTTMAKTLAKTAYSSPGVVFSVALSHIEAYQNLTEAVVECAKYFTDLGYDVLVWSLVSALGGKHRNRTNAEFALLPSRWLLALSQFSGKVFKRYSIMNLSPVIQYINDQLYRGNSMDLVILKELISQMAGIVPDTDFTDAQLTALTGGEALRKHTLMTLQDKRYESGKTSKRLMRTLTETKISGALLIAIAQHRQAAIYKVPDEDAHIKLLATMIDDTQLILSQYLDLLRSNFTGEEFDEHVPGIPELMIDFGLEPALAFMIGRSRLADRIAKAPSPVLNGVTTKVVPTTAGPIDAEGDISMEAGDVQSQADIEKNSAPENDHVPVKEDTQAADLKNGTPPQASPNPTSDILGPIVASVNVALPEGSFKAISPEFYVTFWTSTLGDLSVSASYNIEIKRLGNKISDLFKDNSDKTRPGISRKNASIDSNTATRDSLQAEYTNLVNAFPQVKARILANKEAWFRASVKSEELSDAILEKCLLPRLLLSPSDADFSFKMIKFLHDNAAPHFRTLSLYTRLFRQNRLRTLIFTCTVREAENLGRFLKSILADLASWHASKSRFEKEAWGPHKDLPGFAKSLDADGKPRAFLDHDGPGKTPGFKSLLLMWHKSLNSALRDCLDGTEWMHIKNAMTVLKSVVEVFPAIDFQGLGFIKQLEAVATREKGAREDLSLTANAVLVQLKKRSKKWVMIQAFHMVSPPQFPLRQIPNTS